MESFSYLTGFIAHSAHDIFAILGAVVVLASASRLCDDRPAIVRLTCLTLLSCGLAGIMQSVAAGGIAVEVLRAIFEVGSAASALSLVIYAVLCKSKSWARDRRSEVDDLAKQKALSDIEELQRITSRYAA